jgi:diguanylate cyclase (GGDEF)-like protein/PAS domain S-box-containing protein
MTDEPVTAAPPVFDLSYFFKTDVAFFSITGNDGYFKRSNAAFERMLGWSEDELLAKSFYELIHPDDIPLALGQLVEVERTGHDVSFDTRFMHRDGRYRWLAWVVQGAAVSDSWYATARDITEQRELQDALELSQERLLMAMSMSESGSWDYELAADRLTLDASAEKLLGLETGSFPGHLSDLRALAFVEDEDRVNNLRTAPHSAQPIETDFRIRAADGSARHIAIRGKVVEFDRRDRPLRAVGITWNVTGQKKKEQALRDFGTHDQLTKLENRHGFEETVLRVWRRCGRAGTSVGVIILDIDDFKQVNDTFGHQAGDRYLSSVAAALAATATRPGDLVARYGGEEFIVLLPDCAPDQARAVAQRLVDAVRLLRLAHPDGRRVVTVSAGASSVLPAGELTPADLIRAADKALYAAKRNGKDVSTFVAVS